MPEQNCASPASAEAHSRLAQLEAEFDRRLEAEKLEAMAEFAAGAGHEINNPLTVISGRAELLLREETDPERRHALALIISQAMRVHEMIADMMLFARPPRPEMQPVELGEMADRLVAALLPACRRQQIALCRTGAPPPIRANADPVQLEAALRAICRNAIEAIGAGGRIEIELGDRRIAVRDNGPGITADQRQHIFDPFYSARQAGRGLGLGLSKAWRIVRNHGGRIEVDSRPGYGTTVTVVLPDSPAGPSR